MTEPRTFDVSTDPNIPDGHAVSPPPTIYGQNEAIDQLPSSLDLLRDAVAEQNAEEIESVAVAAPGGAIRLWCTANIPSKDLQRWQRRALPQIARKRGGTPDLSQMDQRTLSVAVLEATTERIEVRDRRTGEWQTIADKVTNEPLTFADDALLGSLGAMDSTTALLKLFRRDSDLSVAAQKVLQAAGWAEKEEISEDEAEDPTT